jgi:putative hydrolase
VPEGSRPEGADRPRADFHAHSFLSDGRGAPTEMWREAELLDHRALALTDHLGLEDPKPLLDRLHREALTWEGSASFRPVVGVELTYVAPSRIAETARAARKAGAEIVIVHGESIVERVTAGTNHAALDSQEIDVLAHPGLLDVRDAELAKAHGVALELTGRPGHCLTNGHVAALALAAGAELVVDSDAHRSPDLIPLERARRIALGAGVPEDRLDAVLFTTPDRILRRARPA